MRYVVRGYRRAGNSEFLVERNGELVLSFTGKPVEFTSVEEAMNARLALAKRVGEETYNGVITVQRV